MYSANGVQYTEEHSISFGSVVLNNGVYRFSSSANTWTDWHLIPSSRPVVAQSMPTTQYIEKTGYGNALDLTEYLIGRATFKMRTGSWSFLIDTNQDSLENIKADMLSRLHGKKFKMVLDDDPSYYYEGYFTVENFAPGASYPTVTINYQLYPYKYKIQTEGSSVVEWNSFNFEMDYDYSVIMGSIEVNSETKTYTIHSNGIIPFIPIVWVSGSVSATFGGVTKTLSSSGSAELGKSQEGNNTLTVTGTGEIKIEWRGGSL